MPAASPRGTARDSMPAPLPDPSTRSSPPAFVCLAVALGAVLAILVAAPAATEYWEFRFADSIGGDLAFYNHAFYLALHDHGRLHSPLQNLYHGGAVEVHFAVIYYALLPLYALWSSSLLLLLISGLAVGMCGAGIMLVARRLLGGAAAAVVWFALFALLRPVGWSIAVNTFREIFIAAAFLSWALLYYVEGNDRLFFAMLILALLSKEDVVLVLPVWGLVAWLTGRGRRKAAALVLLGIVDFILVNMVLLPLMRGMHAGTFVIQSLDSPLGNTPGGLFHSLTSSPGSVIRLVLSAQDRGYWAAILSPLMFLPLLGWEYLVIPVYVYAEIVLAPWMQFGYARHIFPAIPFLFAAGALGARRVVDLVGRIAAPSAAAARAQPVALTAILAAALVSAAAQTDLFYVLGRWPTPAAYRAAGAPLFHALGRIPPRASLAATEGIVA
jgi:uncharacterized membrane protein